MDTQRLGAAVPAGACPHLTNQCTKTWPKIALDFIGRGVEFMYNERKWDGCWWDCVVAVETGPPCRPFPAGSKPVRDSVRGEHLVCADLMSRCPVLAWSSPCSGSMKLDRSPHTPSIPSHCTTAVDILSSLH